MLVVKTGKPLERSASLDQFLFDLDHVLMVLQWESSQFRNGPCSRKAIDEMPSLTKTEVLTVPIDLFAVKSKCWTASGFDIASVLQSKSALFFVLDRENNSAGLKDHPARVPGNNLVQDVVISGLEVVFELFSHDAVEEIEVRPGL